MAKRRTKFSPKFEFDCTLERVTTKVPWPRGIVFQGSKLFALARGCPRGAGGPHKFVFDHAGSIYSIKSSLGEIVSDQAHVSSKIRNNGKIIAAPTSDVFKLFDRSVKQPYYDIETDRPYATLVWDSESKNFFICGFSGIDNAPNKSRFRKNGTDAILRYDTRSKSWHIVERHDAKLIPIKKREDVTTTYIPSEHYAPKSRAPKGWLNGPDSLLIIGKYLYAAGKDNHTIVQYDLTKIRKNPNTRAPSSKSVLSGKRMGGVPRTDGPSALAHIGNYLYIGFRTTSRIVRFLLDNDRLIQPIKGKLVADFGKGNELIDMTVRGTNELFVSMKKGDIWRIPTDQKKAFRPDVNTPYFTILGSSIANIAVSAKGHVYVCTNNYDDKSSPTAGTIYRIVEHSRKEV